MTGSGPLIASAKARAISATVRGVPDPTLNGRTRSCAARKQARWRPRRREHAQSRAAGVHPAAGPEWYVDDDCLWRSLRQIWRKRQRVAASQNEKHRPLHKLAAAPIIAEGYRRLNVPEFKAMRRFVDEALLGGGGGPRRLGYKRRSFG
jgi:hypothetical protein